ncbi:hypothetical protein BZA70DRAFT_285633 [Myxozyma melibiosi]|uniref:CHY-type domain-containing protein n=1 Tax=Myxozyma melibiosi TaxID=54550 RepID=A0ABR1EYQ1_9ASCO
MFIRIQHKAKEKMALNFPSLTPIRYTICRFYNTPAGCQRGSECPYKHQKLESVKPAVVVDDSTPRSKEISQVLEKFPYSEVEGDKIHTAFKPSDPEFPFDLDSLEFTLLIPARYPLSPADDEPEDLDAVAPSIVVTNSDIPRGFALNIEHGFLDLISKPGLYTRSLVEMVVELDRRLEEFLKAQKRETIKIVNIAKTTTAAPAQAEQKESKENKEYNAFDEWGIDPNHGSKEPTTEPEPEFTPQQLQEAQKRREREVKQLLVRLPSAKIIRTSTEDDEPDKFAIPFEPPAQLKSELPASLAGLTSFTLVVPKLYWLAPCEVEVDIADREVKDAAENGFKKHASERGEFSLFAHANFFVQNVGKLAVSGGSESTAKEDVEQDGEDEYRNPPEWDILDDDEEEDDDEYGFDYDSVDYSEGWEQLNTADAQLKDNGGENRVSDDDDDDEQGAQEDARKFTPPANATALNLPGIKLLNVAVLECTLLSLVVKCTRCKTEAELRDIRPHASTANSGAHSQTCEKCSSVLAVDSFYTEFVHPPIAERLGYVDLLGCTAVDILPSSFRPTCADCSEPVSGTGIAGLGLAQTMSTNCRNCHSKMSIFIPSIKFIRVSDETGQALTARDVSKSKSAAAKKLGIVAGTPLPLNGTCQHYRRSTRWFRFSCCGRVFPCDKCHDEHSDHVNEHASRMVCGMCSREQNYMPDNCAYCRHSFHRKSTGFWEGGMGTRDKVKMSRKDPRKYKRR